MPAESMTSLTIANNPVQARLLAVRDIVEGMLNYRLWWFISWHEVRQRYRRSSLGPFWLTLSMGIQAMVMGYLLGFLFGVDNSKFLPFVSVSLVIWNMIVGCLQEGSTTFIGSAGTITQIRRPLTSYVMRTIARNLIIFFHTILIYFLIAFAFGIYPSIIWLLSIFGLALVVLNLVWMCLLFAIMSARFRDIPMIIQNTFSILLWLTPVFYQPSQLHGRMNIITAVNPLSYFLEVIREPLMNQLPRWESFVVLMVLGVVGWGVTLLLFERTRSRIAYWV